MPVLEDLAAENPMRGFQAALVAKRLKNFEKANTIAGSSLSTLTTMLEEDPTNLSISLAVARNQLFLEQYKDAIVTLGKAVKLAKTEEEQNFARTSLGDAIVAFVKNIEDTSGGSVTDRVQIFEYLQVALQYAPKNPRVLQLVTNQILATLNDDDEQIAALRKALVSGVSPGVAHFIRGTAALMKNDSEVAARELKLAKKDMPLSSAVMNNLAVVLTQNKDVDLEQPLTIIEEAIKITPNAPPHYFETRGQILMRMERFEDAIPDLERVLADPSLEKKAHLDLAICYEKVNDQQMADDHRQAAADFDQAVAEAAASRN